MSANTKETTKEIIKKEEKPMEFTPFGSQDKIRLSINIIRRLVAVPTATGKLPSDDECIKFMMLCSAKRLNPFEQDAYMIGYDTKHGPKFSQITAHQVFLKRAEASPTYDGMESGVLVRKPDGSTSLEEGDYVEDDWTLLGGWCRVHKKGQQFPIFKKIKLSTFDKNTSQWVSNKSGMIVKCFDPETEILTTRGFEKFANAEGRILQVTEHGLEATDAVPFMQRYSGEMICLRNQNLDFCVTPNHDMVTSHGKIEAGKMFDESNQRRKFRIPRIVTNAKPDATISDTSIILAAVFLADGCTHKSNKNLFRVSVSRDYKIALLDSLNCHRYRYVRPCAGDQATAGTRVITTKKDKVEFYFEFNEIAEIVGRDKQCIADTILKLSSRQSDLLCNTLLECDGCYSKEGGTQRYYASKMQVLQAFELVAVCAGYSVSERHWRQGDIGGPNASVSVTRHNEVAVSRNSTGPKLHKAMNHSGEVWCVTVPSHNIVVRRHGFSFVCGQCAEADALRTSFPTLLGSLYIKEELQEASETTAVARPLFREPVRHDATVVDIPPEPVADPKHLETLHALMEKDKVDEKILIELLQASGLAGDGCNSVADLNPEDLIVTLSSWPTLLEQLKGVES